MFIVRVLSTLQYLITMLPNKINNWRPPRDGIQRKAIKNWQLYDDLRKGETLQCSTYTIQATFDTVRRRRAYTIIVQIQAVTHFFWLHWLHWTTEPQSIDSTKFALQWLFISKPTVIWKLFVEITNVSRIPYY